jgi:hypothetical protein
VAAYRAYAHRSYCREADELVIVGVRESFKCFNVCFRIIQYILVHLLVLIISNYRQFKYRQENCHLHLFLSVQLGNMPVVEREDVNFFALQVSENGLM